MFLIPSPLQPLLPPTKEANKIVEPGWEHCMPFCRDEEPAESGRLDFYKSSFYKILDPSDPCPHPNPQRHLVQSRRFLSLAHFSGLEQQDLGRWTHLHFTDGDTEDVSARVA